MEIHLNAAGGFYYLMKLHYSQTFALLILSSIGFTTL